MAVRVLLVGMLLNQLNVKEENHCEAQSFTKTMDRKWRPAKMADVVFDFAEDLGRNVNPRSSCWDHAEARCSICHLW